MASKKKILIIPSHNYIPKHEIMTKKDSLEVLEKYHCKPTELPLILVTDPAIMRLE